MREREREGESEGERECVRERKCVRERDVEGWKNRCDICVENCIQNIHYHFFLS